MCEHEYRMFVDKDHNYAGAVSICVNCWKTNREIELESQLAAANARVAELEADLNESHVDEHGTVWTRPTAEAYCLICKAYDTWKTKAEQAEAQCAAMQTAISRYVMGNIELLDALKAALEENP